MVVAAVGSSGHQIALHKHRRPADDSGCTMVNGDGKTGAAEFQASFTELFDASFPGNPLQFAVCSIGSRDRLLRGRRFPVAAVSTAVDGRFLEVTSPFCERICSDHPVPILCAP